MNENIYSFGKEIYRAGKWVLTEEEIYWDGNIHYPIIKERLRELRPDGENDKFDWPLHLIEKTWQTVEDIYHFNTVFFYALDYFGNAKNNAGCIWKTLRAQKILLESKENNFNFLAE